MHFADRLLDTITRKGSPVCVGIDPVLEKLPRELQPSTNGSDEVNINEAVAAITSWTRDVLDAVVDHVPVVKFQSACFERYLWHGVEALHRLIHLAHEMGLVVICDAKRGDIGISSSHYAAGNLADSQLQGAGTLKGADALTVNGYMGHDCLQPFIDVAIPQKKGLFSLVRTSNPGGDRIQTLKLADGRQMVDEMATFIAELGEQSVGDCGYSLLGAVVGATKVEDIARMRELMPQQIFLVPGYGAQGGGAEDVKASFKEDGTGAIITASRSVIYAHTRLPDMDWKDAVAQGARELNTEIREILA
ncbi:MAG: orotidine-5'-phosphate decarboxylase [Phycisphaeraceae bacterium]|nr:orotidine-5'-phosphate decarboxylase [Phycisphaeraceae bacterium]